MDIWFDFWAILALWEITGLLLVIGLLPWPTTIKDEPTAFCQNEFGQSFHFDTGLKFGRNCSDKLCERLVQNGFKEKDIVDWD